MNYILGILYLIFTTLGVACMKFGGNSLKISFSPNFTFEIGLFTFLGFLFYMVSFVLWQRLLISNNVSFVVPVLTGLAQIASCILAFTFFKEQVTVYNFIGIILIVCGITFLAIRK